jgi:hypothetical protein
MWPVEPYSLKADALRPLMTAFWTPQVWRSPHLVPGPVEFARAVRDGVMFAESLTLDHDGWVDRVLAAVALVDAAAVSDAFIVSLTTRRLDLRSAMGSYAVARHLPRHSFYADRSGRLCRVCGLYERDSAQDLNVLSFERFKWGGVRRDDLRYIAFDLEQFQLAPQEPLNEAAIAVGGQMLAALRGAPPSATSTTVARALPMIKGNAQERGVLVDILGVAGVLDTKEHPGYHREFISYAERELPNRHFVDSAYPACWWRGGSGVNEDAVQQLLPRLA